MKPSFKHKICVNEFEFFVFFRIYVYSLLACTRHNYFFIWPTMNCLVNSFFIILRVITHFTHLKICRVKKQKRRKENPQFILNFWKHVLFLTDSFFFVLIFYYFLLLYTFEQQKKTRHYKIKMIHHIVSWFSNVTQNKTKKKYF
jgi:hypothetical protein